MFVCNFKVNKKLLFKIFFSIIFILVIIISGFSIFKIFNYNNANSCVPKTDIVEIDSKNYTNILRSVHDNLDEYIGQKISFTGYVYRVYDFSDNQFVLARDMVISSDNQTVVVGFLCSCKSAQEFSDNSWVHINGTITKGDYHGDIPVIEISQIEACSKPENFYVYPPDDTYIPTSVLNSYKQ